MTDQEQRPIVCKIRPVSWKICVQGEKEAEYVRKYLQASGATCELSQREPDLNDPPVFSFIMIPKNFSPLTSEELQSLFEEDEKIRLAWEE